MSMQAGTTPGSHFRRGWIYALMLALVTINYMDRSALGVVAQAVRGEFGLSPVQMGYPVLVVPVDLRDLSSCRSASCSTAFRRETSIPSASRCGRWR